MKTESSLLDHDEQSIWSGSPKAMWFVLRQARLPVAFGILSLFVLCAYFLDFNHASKQLNLITEMILTGIMGLICIIAAVWTWVRASRTTYLLTNRRVVIDTAGPIPRRISMPLEHVRLIDRRSKLFGPSDLMFSETPRARLDGWGHFGDGFIAIPDATRVEGLVRAAIEQTFTTRTRGPWQ
jgi:hypothetical protein